MSTELKLRRVTARVFRCPLEQPVTTSFGTMRDRPMVTIEVEDDQGVRGWGEAWCNFPAVGAEHRARLVDSVLTPLLLARSFRGRIRCGRLLVRVALPSRRILTFAVHAP